MGPLAPVLAGAPDPVPVPDHTPVLAPHLRVVLLRPLRPPRMARFIFRATTSVAFNVASSVVILVTVVVNCAMAARALAMTVNKFVIRPPSLDGGTCRPGLWWRCVQRRRGHQSRF